MLRILVCCLVVAIAHWGLLAAINKSSSVRFAVGLGVGFTTWLTVSLFVARDTALSPVEWTSATAAFVSATAIAGCLARSTRLTLGSFALATAAVTVLLSQPNVRDQFDFVVAAVIVASAMAAVAFSTREVATGPARTKNSAEPGRHCIAVVTSALLAMATATLFHGFVARGLDPIPAEGWQQRVVVLSAAAAMISVAAVLEIAEDAAYATGPLVILGVAMLVVAIGEQAVMPACCLAAAVLIGPLINEADRQREAGEAIAHGAPQAQNASPEHAVPIETSQTEETA